MRFGTSDADAREISAGSALLLDDVVGRGHLGRVLGGSPVILAIVQLPAHDGSPL